MCILLFEMHDLLNSITKQNLEILKGMTDIFNVVVSQGSSCHKICSWPLSHPPYTDYHHA